MPSSQTGPIWFQMSCTSWLSALGSAGWFMSLIGSLLFPMTLEMAQKERRMSEKISGQPDMLALFIGNLADVAFIKRIDGRFGKGHEDRRVGSDDELGMVFCYHSFQHGKKRKLAHG